MKLFESINLEKGITLNSQLVDLLSIIDDEALTHEEQDARIIEYVDILRGKVSRMSEYTKSMGEALGKNTFLVDEIINNMPGNLSIEERDLIKQIYLKGASDLSMVDTDKMKEVLRENGFDSSIAEYMLIKIKNNDYTAKEGILDMTPEKIRAMHDFMFKGGNKFDFMNIDDAGKYSGYVSFDAKTMTPFRLDKMFDFTKRHGMKTKINTFMFYADFPLMYEAYCMKKYTTNEMTEEEKINVVKPYIKKTLFDYIENVCDRYGDNITAVDILNEIIYDPEMIESNFRDSEEHTYHQRTGQWMKYMSVDDLAELALTARKRLPNTRFVYNDMNWVDPEKRKEIIDLVKKLQEKELEFRRDGRLSDDERGIIDSIGLEAHLDTGVDIEQLNATLDDIEKEIGLPVEITELDIARGENPLAKEEIEKQQKIIARIQNLATQTKEGRPRISAVAMWSQNDDLCFMNQRSGYKVYGSVVDSNFEEKEFEPEKTNENQKFNFHTHTSLCGHASGEMREYVEKAIEAGFESIGFSDHNPPALGKAAPNTAMTMEQFKEEYLPTLRNLRDEYADRIEMKIGLEVEYYGDEGEKVDIIKSYREQVESELDYMILGQHFAIARDENGRMINPPRKSDPNSSRYPIDYALSVTEAMKTGKFAYVAHPDIFLKNRDKIPEEQREEYNKNSKIAMEMICSTAARYKIPLEINLGAISATRAGIPGKGFMKDGTYAYPVPDFWRVAEEKGCDVLIGTDAHDPEALIDRSNEKIAREIMKEAGINLHYLDSFEPLGIGNELNRLSQGEKVVNEMTELSDDIRDGEIQEVAKKIIIAEKESEQEVEDTKKYK